MKILDCESIDSTYASIEEIFRIGRPLLEEILGNLDLDRACRRAEGRPGSKILLDAVMKHARAAGPTFDRTCWFHVTRSRPGNSFRRGLLPLRDALPFVWGFLLMLLPEDFPVENWYEFATDPPSASYHARMNNPGSHGPFASLPRDACLSHGQAGIHDSPDAPEIVEEICSAFRAEFGVDLLRSYRENTRPCIVTFVDSGTGPEYLGAALHFLYRHLRGEPPPGDCRVDFNARGVAIPPESIRKVEIF